MEQHKMSINIRNDFTENPNFDAEHNIMTSEMIEPIVAETSEVSFENKINTTREEGNDAEVWKFFRLELDNNKFIKDIFNDRIAQVTHVVDVSLSDVFYCYDIVSEVFVSMSDAYNRIKLGLDIKIFKGMREVYDSNYNTLQYTLGDDGNRYFLNVNGNEILDYIPDLDHSDSQSDYSYNTLRDNIIDDYYEELYHQGLLSTDRFIKIIDPYYRNICYITRYAKMYSRPRWLGDKDISHVSCKGKHNYQLVCNNYIINYMLLESNPFAVEWMGKFVYVLRSIPHAKSDLYYPDLWYDMMCPHSLFSLLYLRKYVLPCIVKNSPLLEKHSIVTVNVNHTKHVRRYVEKAHRKNFPMIKERNWIKFNGSDFDDSSEFAIRKTRKQIKYHKKNEKRKKNRIKKKMRNDNGGFDPEFFDKFGNIHIQSAQIQAGQMEWVDDILILVNAIHLLINARSYSEYISILFLAWKGYFPNYTIMEYTAIIWYFFEDFYDTCVMLFNKVGSLTLEQQRLVNQYHDAIRRANSTPSSPSPSWPSPHEKVVILRDEPLHFRTRGEAEMFFLKSGEISVEDEPDEIDDFITNNAVIGNINIQGSKDFLYDSVIKMIFSDKSQLFSRSDFGNAARKLLMSTTLAPVIYMMGGIDKMGEYNKWYEHSMGGWDYTLDLAENLINFIYNFSKTGLPFLKSGGDVSFLYPEKTWHTWLEAVDIILADLQHPSRIQKRLLNERKEVYATLEKLIAEGRMYHTTADREKIISASSAILRKLDALLEGRRKLDALCTVIDGKNAAYAVVIYGDSAVGKSMIVDILHSYFAGKNGYAAQGSLYHHNPSDQYFSGYTGQPGMIIDDAGAHNEDNIKPEGMETFLQAVGTIPFMTNQAALEDKGVVPLMVEWMITTSNFRDFRAWVTFKNVAAALRRNRKYIKTAVRSQYCKEGSSALDPEKIRGITDFSYYSFTISEIITLPRGEYQWKVTHEDINILEMMKIIGEDYELHMAGQKRVKDLQFDINSSGICDKHKTLSMICGCVVPPRVIQVLEPSATYTAMANKVWDSYKEKKSNDPPIGEDRDVIYPIIQGGIISNCKRRCKREIINIITDEETLNSVVAGVVKAAVKPPASQVIADISVNKIPQIHDFVGLLLEKYRNEAFVSLGKIGLILAGIMSGYAVIKALLSIRKVSVDSKVIATPSLIERRDQFDARLGFEHVVSESFPKVRPEPKTYHADNFYVPRPDNFLPKLHEIMLRNTYHFVWKGIGETYLTSQSICFYLTGNICVFPAHAIQEKNGVVVLSKSLNGSDNQSTQYVISPSNVYQISKDSDWYFIQLEGSIPHPSIERFLLPFDNIKKVIGFGEIVVPSIGDSTVVYETSIGGYTEYVVNGFRYKSLNYTIDKLLPFKGLCGAPVFGEDNKSVRGLFGAHAGQNKDPKDAFFNILSLEMWKEVQSKFKYGVGHSLNSGEIEVQSVIRNTNITDLSPRSVLRYVPEIDYVGTDLNYHPRKLKPEMRRTIVADSIPYVDLVAPTGMPFVNDKGQFVDFMLHRISQMNRVPRDIDPDLILISIQTLKTSLRRLDLNSIQPLNMKVLLNGFPGSHAKRVNVSAGAGPVLRGKKKDHLYFSPVDEIELFPSERIFELMEDTYKHWLHNLSVFFMHDCTPKMNQAISQKKVDDGKQRTFLTSDFELFLWMKCLFEEFFGLMRFNSHSAIGVNPSSSDWKILYHQMLNNDGEWKRKGTFTDGFIVDGDYSWYDIYNFLIGHVIRMIYDLLENNPHFNRKVEWFPGLPTMSAREVMLHILYEISVFPTRIRGDVFWSILTIASGWFGTAEFNSLCESVIHIMVYYVCYMKYGQKHKCDINKPPLEVEVSHKWQRIYNAAPVFDEYVILKNYGDDNMDNTAKEIQFFYNPENRSEINALLGFPITDARKSEVLHYVHMSEVIFLKRRFFRYEGVILAPLEEKSILGMLTMYAPSVAKSPEKHIVDNILDAQRQYFHYGKETFNKQTAWLQSLIVKYHLQNYAPSFDQWLTFDQLMDMYLKDDELFIL